MSEQASARPRGAAGISIENVNLSFGANHVLKDISLQIEPGEFFAFLGPSGCGKTTLLRLIAGFGQAQKGTVRIGGQDVSGLPPWRRDVGMVFQSYALWPHMSVRHNVAFGLEERKVPRRQIRARVDAALELVSLAELGERRPSQLSGGQQQRVALARTVVVEPQVLLLDEPLSNLDANLRVQMRRELLDLQRKLALTTIFVTHDQEEANTTADRIAVMEGGAIRQVGTPAELYDNPKNLFVANFLGTANVLDGVVQGEGDAVSFRSTEGIDIPLANAQLRASSRRGVERHSAIFRPQNLRIVPAGSAEPQRPGTVSFPGVIEHREFLGGLVRYSVRVSAHEMLVDDAHQRGQDPISTGADVVLYLDSDQVVLLME